MFTLTKELPQEGGTGGGGDYGRTLRSIVQPVPWCEIAHAHICRSNVPVTSRSHKQALLAVTSRSCECCSSAVLLLQIFVVSPGLSSSGVGDPCLDRVSIRSLVFRKPRRGDAPRVLRPSHGSSGHLFKQLCFSPGLVELKTVLTI